MVCVWCVCVFVFVYHTYFGNLRGRKNYLHLIKQSTTHQCIFISDLRYTVYREIFVLKKAMYEYQLQYIYKEEWEAAVGEELKCERERNNTKDPYAVAVVRENVIVSHLPRRISRISALFLKRQGKISYKVLGRHRYSCGLATRGPRDSVCKFSLFKKFRVLNFRGLLRPRKFFNNENFPIYGMFIYTVGRAGTLLILHTFTSEFVWYHTPIILAYLLCSG